MSDKEEKLGPGCIISGERQTGRTESTVREAIEHARQNKTVIILSGTYRDSDLIEAMVRRVVKTMVDDDAVFDLVGHVIVRCYTEVENGALRGVQCHVILEDHRVAEMREAVWKHAKSCLVRPHESNMLKGGFDPSP